jgi:Cys-rich repeat protein
VSPTKTHATLGLAALVTLAGCTFGQSAQSPQSHFAFPNSNVVPLGAAHGSATKLCGLLFIVWGSPDADDQELATQRALETSSGDLLINVRTDSSLFAVPYLFAICKTSVRGTAARMEVGRQVLLPMNPGAGPPPAPAPAPAAGGCTQDSDCKAGRVCRAGACTSP